jgi:hypothetical protein
MTIRLFTSGTHKNSIGVLNFSNDDIERIYTQTSTAGLEQIPFVLGHPKNNLPIVGWLPRTAIQKYSEGDKVSLGFSRDAAELSAESMDVIRKYGSNKISVRIENGAIRHIGLVEKAAVSENNAQNFSYDELSGDFATDEDILEKQQSDFSRFINEFKTIFKTNTMADEKKEVIVPPTTVDLSALIEQNKQLTATIGALQQTVTALVNKTKASADFSAEEYKHLTAAQRDSAVAIIADLGDEQATALKGLIKELAKPAVTVRSGSVAKDFGRVAGEELSLREVIDEQIKNLI